MFSKEKSLPGNLALALAASRVWYESEGKNGKPLYLAYETYEGIDFSGELFTEAILQEAHLIRSSLEGVVAVRALANGIHLNNSILHFSNWTKAEMEGADFSAVQGKSVQFVKAILRESIFCESNFSDSNFSQAICTRADFTKSCLAGANFNNALLDEANFQDADISGAIFSGCHLSKNTKISIAHGLEKVQCTHLFFLGERLDGAIAKDCLKNL